MDPNATFLLSHHLHHGTSASQPTTDHLTNHIHIRVEYTERAAGLKAPFFLCTPIIHDLALVGVRDTLLVAALAHARIIKQPIKTLPILRQHPEPPVINRCILFAFHYAGPQDLAVHLRV